MLSASAVVDLKFRSCTTYKILFGPQYRTSTDLKEFYVSRITNLTVPNNDRSYTINLATVNCDRVARTIICCGGSLKYAALCILFWMSNSFFDSWDFNLNEQY